MFVAAVTQKKAQNAVAVFKTEKEMIAQEEDRHADATQRTQTAKLLL